MYKRFIKPVVVVLLLAATTVLFVRYFQTHPESWRTLTSISPWVIAIILVQNVLMTIVLTLINIYGLELIGKKIAWKEMFLLTSYSSVVNFFGPLQSGPSVRGLYLKKVHNVRLRDYTAITLLVLGMFALGSLVFLLIGTLQPAILVTLLIATTLVGYLFRQQLYRLVARRIASLHITPRLLTILAALTFAELVIIASWYYVELRAVDPTIGIGQVISYSGAANFALFVSITPDAVGIREAFLLFSQNLHHVSTKAIVSANVIDRAAYVLYLIILFIFVLSMHAKERLHIKQLRKKAEN